MGFYRVTWEIDLEVESPVMAAEQARAILLDRGSVATGFEVEDYETGLKFTGDKLE